MWLIFEEPPNQFDSAVLALHTETFVEFVIGRQDSNFTVTFQKPFDEGSTGKPLRMCNIEVFRTWDEAITFARKIVDALKNGEHYYQVQKYFAGNIDVRQIQEQRR